MLLRSQLGTVNVVVLLGLAVQHGTAVQRGTVVLHDTAVLHGTWHTDATWHSGASRHHTVTWLGSLPPSSPPSPLCAACAEGRGRCQLWKYILDPNSVGHPPFPNFSGYIICLWWWTVYHLWASRWGKLSPSLPKGTTRHHPLQAEMIQTCVIAITNFWNLNARTRSCFWSFGIPENLVQIWTLNIVQNWWNKYELTKNSGYLDEDNNPINMRSEKTEHNSNFANAK